MRRASRSQDGKRAARRRPATYYSVAGLDLRAELERLCRLTALGGEAGPLVRRPPTLTIRRASKCPRSRLGFAIPEEWRISVTAYPGQRQGDAEETLVHELVHLFVGASSGTRRWHGREFRATMRRAMKEAYGLGDVKANASYHGAYADALERRRARESASSKSLHPGQLALIDAA
ncbi:MAG TPA: SprT-like domain-containing protein [Solirubrobacterales bacterium]